MIETLRIASWNIAGAHTINSDRQFDYAPENLDYFIEQLREQHLDVICLQESHVDGVPSNAQAIAQQLDLPYVYELDCSVSHIDAVRRLGLAIISRQELSFVESVTFPYPAFADTFADGTPAQHHDKKMQVYTYKDLTILNMQMLPMPLFGKTYERGDGAVLARQIDELLAKRSQEPLIAAGDFNFTHIETIYPRFHAQSGLRESFAPVPTRPHGDNVDHILVSRHVRTSEGVVVVTSSDHYLCASTISWDSRAIRQSLEAQDA